MSLSPKNALRSSDKNYVRRGEELRPDFSKEQHAINPLSSFESCLACNRVWIFGKELYCKMLNICSIYMDYMISRGAFNYSHDTIKYVLNYQQKCDYIIILYSLINFMWFILITLGNFKAVKECILQLKHWIFGSSKLSLIDCKYHDWHSWVYFCVR